MNQQSLCFPKVSIEQRHSNEAAGMLSWEQEHHERLPWNNTEDIGRAEIACFAFWHHALADLLRWSATAVDSFDL